ncbi:RNA-binding protein 34-like isoform X2 [Apis florea]|uniref:RNA-binding protein 34-like isoform X2 n=1 Tax=Apis florea TaxID=7463 RepID=UPI0012FF330B|nr:RNA-binding protein 34-like isoform X2 [Apis florea]
MVKAISTKNKDLISKNSLNSPKDGFIHKKKNQKFKQTPIGRVPLINGSKVQNSSMKQQIEKNNSPQKSLEQNKKLKKKNQEKNDKKQESLKKQSIKKNVKVEEVESDSEDDINEGIKLEESIMENSDDNESDSFDDDDDDDESEEEEETVKNILGTSLADESDEDDEDYEENKDTKVNKGIKMFDGSKSSDKSTDSIQESSELSSVMEDSMIDDSDDDIEEEEEEEDDEDEDEDEDENEDEEEEVDGEEADEEEGDESTLGLKALLSNSIAEDDDDDEDFVEPDENDEDDDISDEEEEEEEEENKVQKNSSSNKNNKIMDTSLEEIKEDERTIFVGNLPKDVTKKKLRKLFKQFGKIDTIRLRGKIAKSVNVSKRVAAIKNELHPKLKSVYAYIKFVSKESVKESLSINGTEFEGNYLRVNASNKSENKFDSKKSIFLGNLHYNIDDNTIIKHFKQCGEIESVRVVRDNKTGVGKGFGYVNFKNEDAVTLALELDGTTISNREVRVKPVIDQYKKKKDKYRKRSHSSENTRTVSHKKLKNDIEIPASVRNKENAMKRISEKGKNLEKKQTNSQQENKFQGQKADANKKKKKPTQFEKKKKLLAEKLTAKSKKPSN